MRFQNQLRRGPSGRSAAGINNTISALLVLVYAAVTMNISQIRGLKLGSVAGFEEFFLNVTTMLGL